MISVENSNDKSTLGSVASAHFRILASKSVIRAFSRLTAVCLVFHASSYGSARFLLTCLRCVNIVMIVHTHSLEGRFKVRGDSVRQTDSSRSSIPDLSRGGSRVFGRGQFVTVCRKVLRVSGHISCQGVFPLVRLISQMILPGVSPHKKTSDEYDRSTLNHSDLFGRPALLEVLGCWNWTRRASNRSGAEHFGCSLSMSGFRIC
jgi:hypothetical protein